MIVCPAKSPDSFLTLETYSYSCSSMTADWLTMTADCLTKDANRFTVTADKL